MRIVFRHFTWLMLAAAAGNAASGPAQDATPPITVQVLGERGFATFTNRLHPGNRIGYRFHEHTPLIHGDVPASTAPDIDPADITREESAFAQRPGVQTCTREISEEGWIPQRWTCHLAPASDGIDLLRIVETASQGLPAYYGVQQCFRLGGVTNQAWRREIAETPAFSEYDLWNATQKDSESKTSLTQVLRGGVWQPLPAETSPVGARTPFGVDIDTLRTGGRLDTMREIGPYAARLLEPADCGLIARANLEQTWVTAIYWEHTSHVTVHHPADCLHAIVNIGGVPPNTRRALRGKIYWFKGSLHDLHEKWRRDFPAAAKGDRS